MSKTGVIYGINGPVIYLKGNTGFKMSEMVYVGQEHLVGEVISLKKDATTVQVFEETSGLRPGETVTATGDAFCTLGPGILDNIFDGIQRPLSVIAEQSGKYISRGMQVDSLDTEKLWDVHMTITPGMEIYGGTIIAEVPETASIVHKSMVPPNLHGVVKSVVPDGKYNITETLAILTLDNGEEYAFKTGCKMAHPDSTSHKQALPCFQTIGYRTAYSGHPLSYCKRRNCSSSGRIWYRKNHDPAPDSKMVRCGYYYLHWMWRTWK